MEQQYDVAIIGGGPGGSTTAALLKKYAPHLSVAVFERELFPREHVGESQLPPIGAILEEMGCYQKVEAANFPIKIGATYRWGQSEKLWDFEFVPIADYAPQSRPREFKDQVKQLAFQVDRAIYDEILLDHAAELGALVFEETKVTKINSSDDTIESIVLENGDIVRAKYFIDATGGVGFLRRAMGVEIQAPTKLQNVAFWDYWENSEWATQFEGGATRVLVMSIGCGWIWYIPIGDTRTSIGFICPAQYFKDQGKSPKELYDWALAQEPLITDFTKNASREGDVRGTKDWSFVADRLYGKNWFMVGESAGFADPILAAGLTLTHTGARELAYTIIALEKGDLDGDWLRDWYQSNQKTRVEQHIRFADFWYAGNGIFTDLQEVTREIASEVGLDLDAKSAFRWLATGVFTHDNVGQAGIGGLDLTGTFQVAQILTDGDHQWQLSKKNIFKVNTDYADKIQMPVYDGGEIKKISAYKRGNKVLPLTGLYDLVFGILRQKKDAQEFLQSLQRAAKMTPGFQPEFVVNQALQVAEVMLQDGWISGKLDPLRPKLNISSPREGKLIHANVETNERIENLK